MVTVADRNIISEILSETNLNRNGSLFLVLTVKCDRRIASQPFLGKTKQLSNKTANSFLAGLSDQSRPPSKLILLSFRKFRQFSARFDLDSFIWFPTEILVIFVFTENTLGLSSNISVEIRKSAQFELKFKETFRLIQYLLKEKDEPKF